MALNVAVSIGSLFSSLLQLIVVILWNKSNIISMVERFPLIVKQAWTANTLLFYWSAKYLVYFWKPSLKKIRSSHWCQHFLNLNWNYIAEVKSFWIISGNSFAVIKIISSLFQYAYSHFCSCLFPPLHSSARVDNFFKLLLHSKFSSETSETLLFPTRVSLTTVFKIQLARRN